MSAELDLSQYLDLFLQEAEEQLEILEQETIKLEEDPSQERMAVIFRAAHTLKGSSRAMGFSTMAELTHEMENVLDQLRAEKLELTTEIADALLACQDSLRDIVGSIADGNPDAVECGELIAQLQGFTGSAPTAKPKAKAKGGGTAHGLDADTVDALKAADEQVSVRRVTVTLHSDCVMKFARAFMVIGVIQDGGELLHSVPSGEDLEEEKFEDTFSLFFQHAATDAEMQAKFEQISEVVGLKLEDLQTVLSAGPVLEVVEAATETVPENLADTPSVVGAPKKAAKAAGAAPAKADESANRSSGQTVRVDVARLDELMNLIGELVIDRTRIAQIGSDLSMKYQDPSIDALGETVGHIARITFDLQDQIMKARMLPIETVFSRFPRVVRDLANKLGKDVKLELLGGDTELDRSVIEVIGDPLLHIIRNSVDHGLEMPDDREQAGKPRQGHVVIHARHQENYIVIEIRDDGRGINAEKIKQKAVEKGVVTAEAAERLTDREVLQFIFHSGFSTAAQVSEVSGRGVGMDIVRSNIQKLGGLIDLETEVGQGTKFTLRLPLTLAIIRGLLVNLGAQVYVLPLGSVVETLLLEPGQIQTVNQQEVIVLRGQTLPLLRLREEFAIEKIASESAEDEDSEGLYVVVVGLAEKRLGLIVDGLVGEKEVVIKSLSRFCRDVPGVSGATILGDGNVALIADVNGLVLKETA